MSEIATLKRPSSEVYHDNEIYQLPSTSELVERVAIIREAAIPPLTIERRWADLPSHANVEQYNLRPDLGPGNSFKSRGAYTAVRAAVLQHGERRIGTASAGNHAQGVANAVQTFAARGYDVIAKIWMPANTPASKINGVTSFNYPGNRAVEIDMASLTFDQADTLARMDEDFHYISPFDNYDVISGQGTVATEALAAHPHTDKLFVTVGGGGLLAGTLESVAALKAAGLINQDLKVVAVLLEGNDSLLQTLHAGTPSPATRLDTLTEGAAVAQIGDIPARIIQQLQEHLEFMTVTRDDLAEAHHHLQQRNHQYPIDETTSLLPQAGARVLAATRNRYSAPELWLTMTTGTNGSVEKTKVLEHHHQERIRQRTRQLRAYGQQGVRQTVAPPHRTPRQLTAKPRLGMASGYIVR